MFGIANYVLIVLGIFLIISSLWNYKVFNPRIWGHYRKKKGVIGSISGFMYRFDILRDYWDGLLGVILCLVGFYGVIYDIHGEGDINVSDITHEIFHKDKSKEDKKDKEDINVF